VQTARPLQSTVERGTKPPKLTFRENHRVIRTCGGRFHEAMRSDSGSIPAGFQWRRFPGVLMVDVLSGALAHPRFVGFVLVVIVLLGEGGFVRGRVRRTRPRATKSRRNRPRATKSRVFAPPAWPSPPGGFRDYLIHGIRGNKTRCPPEGPIATRGTPQRLGRAIRRVPREHLLFIRFRRNEILNQNGAFGRLDVAGIISSFPNPEREPDLRMKPLLP
jgi:hypothetical protein